jgi:hypothetical protein
MSYDVRIEHWLPGETPVQRTLREAHKAFQRRDLQETKEVYYRMRVEAARCPAMDRGYSILVKPQTTA